MQLQDAQISQLFVHFFFYILAESFFLQSKIFFYATKILNECNFTSLETFFIPRFFLVGKKNQSESIAQVQGLLDLSSVHL